MFPLVIPVLTVCGYLPQGCQTQLQVLPTDKRGDRQQRGAVISSHFYLGGKPCLESLETSFLAPGYDQGTDSRVEFWRPESIGVWAGLCILGSSGVQACLFPRFLLACG
jgi:hypothetical protein